MNATAAYAAAYPKACQTSAETGGSRLMQKLEIQAEITKLRGEADALGGSAVMTLLEKRAFLAAIVRTPVGSVQADSPLAEEMKTDAKGGLTVKLPCKLRAIELDSKLAGDLQPEKDKPTGRTDDLETALGELRALTHGGSDQ